MLERGRDGHIVQLTDGFGLGKIRDYTTAALDGYDQQDVQDLLTDRFRRGRQDLDDLREQLRLLCEPVVPPRGTPEFMHFFCGNPAITSDLTEREGRRRDLYKYTAALLRAFAELASDLEAAGYTAAEATEIEQAVRHYEKLRDEVKITSGEAPDLKRYEADMRFIFDNYVKAEESEKLGALDDFSLIELVVAKGLAEAISQLPKGIRESKEAVAETIENNVRRLIIDENATNPKYFAHMSVLLEELIARRQREAIEYEAYLAEIAELCAKVKNKGTGAAYPPALHTQAQRNLYDNLDKDEALTLAMDDAIQYVKQDGWRENRVKKQMVRNAISTLLHDDATKTEEILQLATKQAEY